MTDFIRLGIPQRLILAATATALLYSTAGCGEDSDPLDSAQPPAPEIGGISIMHVARVEVDETGEDVDEGVMTLDLSVVDAGGTPVSDPAEVAVRVWETPETTGERGLVFEWQGAAAVAASPELRLFAAPKAQDDKDRGKVEKRRPKLHVALVLDRSGSLNADEEGSMESSALAVLDQLSSNDKVSVINFSTNYTVDASFRGSQSQAIRDAIISPSVTSGWTRMYDAVVSGISGADGESRGKDDQGAVVVITDGEDNRSDATVGDAIASAQGADTPVFVVGLADASDPSDLNSGELTRLADETGGRFLRTVSADFLSPIMLSVVGGLAEQLEVEYTSPNVGVPREVEVEVSARGTTRTATSKVKD